MTTSTSPAARRDELEKIIERGLSTFVEVGNALLEIRDSRLYRDTHGTFEDYCRERWQMSYRRAVQLMDAAEIVSNLNNCSETPSHESQVRPLTGLEPEQQREVWKEAVNSAPNGKPTAKDVDAAVNQLKAPSKSDSPPRVDSWSRLPGNNGADVKPAPNEDSKPGIPKANLKKLVSELWTTALRNVPPKQEIEVAQQS